MRSTLFAPTNLEKDIDDLWVEQNRHALRVRLTHDREIVAWKGAMIAYQGDIDFDHKGSGSFGKLMRRMISSDNVPLMSVSGDGEVFLAAEAAEVHLVHLEGESLTINGSSLLAFDAHLEHDLQRVKGAGIAAGGLWNTTVSGTGTVALATVGYPVVLECQPQPTFTDVHATVAWTTTLHPTLNRTFKAKAAVGLGSGEAVQYAFHGPGFVIVQPYEGRHASTPGSSSSGSGIGGLFDLANPFE